VDHRIVVNHEEQYSIWPADQDLPAGWTAVGEPGSRESCLERIGELWTDLRPLSVRTAASADAGPA
jgi:MbtH protein